MSVKPIADKLRIKPNSTVWLSDTAHVERIGPLPDGVSLVDTLDQAAAAVIFANDEASLRGLLTTHKEHLGQQEIFWVAYPKANRTDINRDTLWPILGEYGMRPNSQVAIDETWSALRFRLIREGEAPFTGGR